MVTPAQFLAELRGLLTDVEKELANRESGQAGVGTAEELLYIRDELVDLEARVTSATISPVNERWFASSRIVTDTWPFDNTLCVRIWGLGNV